MFLIIGFVALCVLIDLAAAFGGILLLYVLVLGFLGCSGVLSKKIFVLTLYGSGAFAIILGLMSLAVHVR